MFLRLIHFFLDFFLCESILWLIYNLIVFSVHLLLIRKIFLLWSFFSLNKKGANRLYEFSANAEFWVTFTLSHWMLFAFCFEMNWFFLIYRYSHCSGQLIAEVFFFFSLPLIKQYIYIITSATLHMICVCAMLCNIFNTFNLL